MNITSMTGLVAALALVTVSTGGCAMGERGNGRGETGNGRGDGGKDRNNFSIPQSPIAAPGMPG